LRSSSTFYFQAVLARDKRVLCRLHLISKSEMFQNPVAFKAQFPGEHRELSADHLQWAVLVRPEIETQQAGSKIQSPPLFFVCSAQQVH
jgi:hypothetical protein